MKSTKVSFTEIYILESVTYLHEDNGFHGRAFQRIGLKSMLNYARIFVWCISLARIQKLPSNSSSSETEILDQNVLNIWQSLITTIMDHLAFLINEPSYRCQLPWAPTYPALSIAFVGEYIRCRQKDFYKGSNSNSNICTSNRTVAPKSN